MIPQVSMIFWILYGSGPFVIVGLWDFCAHFNNGLAKPIIPLIQKSNSTPLLYSPFKQRFFKLIAVYSSTNGHLCPWAIVIVMLALENTTNIKQRQKLAN